MWGRSCCFFSLKTGLANFDVNFCFRSYRMALYKLKASPWDIVTASMLYVILKKQIIVLAYSSWRYLRKLRRIEKIVLSS